MEQKNAKNGHSKGARVLVTKIVSAGLMVATLVAVVATAVGLNSTAAELAQGQTAAGVLASANVSDAAIVSVPVKYYGQQADACVDMYDLGVAGALNARQFGWVECGYYQGELEEGMVEPELMDGRLVAIGGARLANRGVAGEGILRWFAGVEGVSRAYEGTLGLAYDAEETTLAYGSEAFYPVEERMFTMDLTLSAKVLLSGREALEIVADDDTWVYVNGRLVLDMGGVHGATTGRLEVNAAGEVYAGVEVTDLAFAGVKLARGSTAEIRVFHANRDEPGSVLRLKLTDVALETDSERVLAAEPGDTAGILAVQTGDGSGDGYVRPLGEQLTVRPRSERVLTVALGTQGAVLAALGVAMVVVAAWVWRCWRR